MLDTWLKGVIRTAVPAAIGSALTYLAVHFGIVIPKDASDGLVLFVGAVLIGVYYAALAALEKAYPAVGRWLLALGLTAAQPSYVKPVKPGRKYADGGTVRPRGM